VMNEFEPRPQPADKPFSIKLGQTPRLTTSRLTQRQRQ
jgi:hypothetical protein